MFYRLYVTTLFVHVRQLSRLNKEITSSRFKIYATAYRIKINLGNISEEKGRKSVKEFTVSNLS